MSLRSGRRRTLSSEDDEDEEEVTAPAPKRARRARGPTQKERLDKLEQMLQQLINQRHSGQPLSSSTESQQTNAQDSVHTAGTSMVTTQACLSTTVTNSTSHNMTNVSTSPTTTFTPSSTGLPCTSTITTSTCTMSRPAEPITENANLMNTSHLSQNSTSVYEFGNNIKFIAKPDNIPKFDGNSNTLSVHAWLHRLESLASIYGWNEKTLIYHMTASLEGNALLWFAHLQDIDITWAEWKQRLAEYFPAGRGLAAKLHDFVTVIKRRDERAIDFYYKKLAQGSIQQPNGEWMTISARSPDKEPTPPPPISAAEPLVQSVRAFLAHELPAKRPPAPPSPPPPAPSDVDIAQHTAREDIKGINFEPRLKRNDLNNNASRQQGETRAMPSQAELMQRQPLLARAAKQDAPPATDESDPDADHSPARAFGDFVVEIPAGAPREERYPKEIGKTILAFFFLFVCVCINMMSLAMVHERLPDRNSTPPLTDIVLDNVAARDWGLAVSEYLIMLATTVAMLVVVFHKHRFIVSRRLFCIIGLLYLYRSVTMFVTVLPVSSTTYYCSPKSNGTTPLLVVRHMFYLISGFGLSINGKHTYCGDYIYSGHTMVLVLSYLVVAEYSPRKLWPVHWAMWGAALLGVCFVLLAHGHYTVDVVIAYYITTRLFWTFHSLLVTPHRHGPGQYMIQREWWYWPFSYLERNVRGPVPRRYDWPLPWPRAKLFSRLS